MTTIWVTDWSGISCSGHPGRSRPGVRASEMIAVACRTASPMVRYRVYCVILAWPDWPSCLRASSRGITTTSSCRMMLAVMYGMIPSAKTESCSSAPPLNRLMIPKMPLWSAPAMHRCTAL